MSKPPKESKTLLGSIEPMSDSERKEFDERNIREWKGRRLLEIIEIARFDKNFAMDLCAEVSRLSYGNRALVNIINQYNVAGSGRLAKTPSDWPKLCLLHYAALMESTDVEDYKEREKAAIDFLIQYKTNFTGMRIKRRSMQNDVSKAIASVDISKLPEWAQKVINTRVDRGRKRRHKE